MSAQTLSQDLYDVIARRRDVRAEFSGETVDLGALRRVLEAAHHAPSVGHSQPWDFVLVFDSGTRGAFAEHVETERRTFAAELPPDRRETFEKIKVEGIRESGLYSTCLAIQNLWLAATAEGLGVGWVSFYREEFLADLVGLPDGVRPVAWLCLGPVTELQEVPDLVRHGWRRGRTLDEAIHVEGWRA
jgi:5,6-dimethylbenzimidazole synthase